MATTWGWSGMSESAWRWAAALMLVANSLLLVLQLRGHAPEPEPAPRIPPLHPSLPGLVLLQERPEPAIAGDDPCFSIGPLSSPLAQQRAEDRLRATARQVRSRQTQSDRDRGWWVFLPAGTRSEALDLTRQLTDGGQEDFFVVTRGEMENVVSVGLYENIDNARTRQQQMIALGFAAEMEIRRESMPQYWVDYQAEPDLPSAWRFIIEASPGAQHRSIPCWND